MRRFIPYIACGLLLVSGWACTRTDDMDIPSANQDKIVIKTTLDPHVVTRATVADEEAERKITRIDVFVVEGDGDIFVHEFHNTQNNFDAADGNGTLALKKARKDFPVNESYNVYLLANATADIESDLNDAKTLDALKAIVQEAFTSTKSVDKVTGEESTTKHTLLHLSGTTHPTDPTKQPPQTFMMDAVATTSSSTSKAVVLNDGVTTNNTSLVAEFKRAAAKIVVNIKQGESVQFERYLLEEKVNQGSAEYVFYNLPTETPILADAEALLSDNNTLIETDPIVLPQKEAGQELGVSYPTFTWKDNVGSVNAEGKGDVKIQIVGYAYAHNWENKPTLNFEPSLLLCLPMYWDANKDLNTPESDGKETMRPGNWYKVPLSQEKKFERNTCYEVNITINAVGAESKSEAIELDDIDYDTRPWEVTTIEIGDDTTTPQYLKLNTDLVTMYNTNVDSEQLIFSSSSPIESIKLTDVYKHNTDGTFVEDVDTYKAYYINKFGQKTNLTNDVVGNISATCAKDALSGNITILSPISLVSETEIQNTILELYGKPAPEQPELNAPYFEGLPPAVEFVPEPTYPDPNDYVPSETERTTRDWYTTKTSTYVDRWGNESEYDSEQKREREGTKYRYNADELRFEYVIGTAVDTRTKSNWYSNSWNTQRGDMVWGSDWQEYTNNTLWNDALTEYNEDLDYYNDVYLPAVKAYDDAMKALEGNEEYEQYLKDKAEYDRIIAQYASDKAAYDAIVAQVRVAAGETHYNTIRYLEFEVKNEEGLTAIFRVMQYPVIYVTNQQGWYSYRDDFGCTYEEKGTRNVSVRLNNSGNNNNFSWSGGYDYSTSAGSDSYFWHSKVVTNYNESTGKSTTSFYQWGENANSPTTNGNCETSANARMYLVRVMSSSPTYTVGIPALNAAGYTDGSEDNAKLVSPSFMIASRLGAIYSTYGNLSSVSNTDDDNNNGVSDRLEIFREHCKQYVEVYKDTNGNGVVLDDWRLPTAAELKIIMDLQGTSTQDAPAIDYLLNGYYYMSASGPVYNTKGSSSNNINQSGIRCVRDAYDDKTPND